MIVNDPATLAEVEAVFARYETALVGNDVATLDELFWQRRAHHPLRRRREPLRRLADTAPSARAARRRALSAISTAR